MDYKLGVGDSLEWHDALAGQLKDAATGKTVLSFKAGHELFRDTQRWRHRNFMVDKRQERIVEKIIDLATGEVVREYDEPLSAHQGRGSAIRKRN